MGCLILNKTYTDPFIEEEVITHVEIVELNSISNYSKRTASNRYEVDSMVYKFIIKGDMGSTLKNANLDIFEYLNLLRTKSKEIKDKFEYTEDRRNGSADTSEGIATLLGIKNIFDKNQEYYTNIFESYMINPY